jgi:hypothetical protein
MPLQTALKNMFSGIDAQQNGVPYRLITPAHGSTEMITFNVLDRIFFIRGAEYGTAFTLDRDGRQYLVTARHLLGTDAGRSAIEVFHDDQWKSLPVRVVGFGVGEVDVAVLAPAVRLSEDIQLEPSMGGSRLHKTCYSRATHSSYGPTVVPSCTAGRCLL